MSELSLEQWNNYLNLKTGGFKCPICNHAEWQTIQNQDGDVAEIKILDQSFENELYNAFSDVIIENGGTEEEIKSIDPQFGNRSQNPSLLKSVHNSLWILRMVSFF